jgi:hypothetical protein
MTTAAKPLDDADLIALADPEKLRSSYQELRAAFHTIAVDSEHRRIKLEGELAQQRTLHETQIAEHRVRYDAQSNEWRKLYNAKCAENEQLKVPVKPTTLIGRRVKNSAGVEATVVAIVADGSLIVIRTENGRDVLAQWGAGDFIAGIEVLP